MKGSQSPPCSSVTEKKEGRSKERNDGLISKQNAKQKPKRNSETSSLKNFIDFASEKERQTH